MSFQDLKNKAGAIDSNLQAAASSTSEKKSYGDDRQWKPTVDKAGNGYAVIRFLPTVEGDDLPWAKYWDHFFQGPTGQWYVEKSLTTIQKDDPVSEMNSKLWNTGIEADKDTARKRKRRLHYVSNICVVSDPENPENRPPSEKPPVSQIISTAVKKPTSAAGMTYRTRNLESGISRRRRAISQVAIRSIYIISKFSVQ